MKIANKRVPKGNILLYISFAAISLVLMLMFSTMRIENINNIFEFSTGSEITTEGAKISFFEKFLSADNIMNAMYIMIIISFILSTLVVTAVWREERHQLMHALKLCGIDNRFQCYEIIKRYVSIIGIGFVSATIVSVILTITDNIIEVKFIDVAWALLTTMITSFVILMISYFFDILKRKIIQ